MPKHSSSKTLQPPTMDSVCLQNTRFHANPVPGTEPCKLQANPLVCMVQTPYFVANQRVLRRFWGLALQNRGFGLQTPCFAQTLSFVGGWEGLGFSPPPIFHVPKRSEAHKLLFLPWFQSGRVSARVFRLRGPAAILLTSRDTCSDSIAKLFRACFYVVSRDYRAICSKMWYRTSVPV